MKKEIIIPIVVVALIILIGISINKEETTNEIKPTSSFKIEARNQFMSECVSDGLYNYCDCAFDALFTKYGANGYIKLGSEYQETGELPEEALNTISSCMPLIN